VDGKAQVVAYGRAVLRHWINVVAGGVMVVVGFIANAVGFVIPTFVWWALGLVFLTVAQFLAYRDVRRDLDALRTTDEQTTERSRRLREDREITGETFHVWELLGNHPAGKPLIEDRTFTDCVIRGPAVITLLSDCLSDHCTYGQGQSIADCLYLVEANRTVVGPIGFVSCKLIRCRMEQIGYVGNAALMEILKKIPTI
jgi:hypothetical protein